MFRVTVLEHAVFCQFSGIFPLFFVLSRVFLNQRKAPFSARHFKTFLLSVLCFFFGGKTRRERNEERESFERSICYNKDLSLRLNTAEEKAPFERERRERVRERERLL